MDFSFTLVLYSCNCIKHGQMLICSNSLIQRGDQQETKTNKRGKYHHVSHKDTVHDMYIHLPLAAPLGKILLTYGIISGSATNSKYVCVSLACNFYFSSGNLM